MKCIACGREMLDRGTHYECSNILCDYEEEIENREEWIILRRCFPQNPPRSRKFLRGNSINLRRCIKNIEQVSWDGEPIELCPLLYYPFAHKAHEQVPFDPGR
jgi:hypothetical protein